MISSHILGELSKIATKYGIIKNGKLIEENLHTSGKDRTWLNTHLSRAGIGQLSETFYAACDNQDNFFACRGE